MPYWAAMRSRRAALHGRGPWVVPRCGRAGACLLALLVGLGACGDGADGADRADGAPAPAGGADVEGLGEAEVRARYEAPHLPPGTAAFAQEIWVSHTLPPGDGRPGWRPPRSRAQALAQARDLYVKVRGGADIGHLARAHSNAPGGRADGFAPLLGLRDPPDVRDRVFLGTPIGSLTPLVEWNGGFWFARRVEASRGRELTARFEVERTRRGRARAIVFHHAGAWPEREETRGIPLEQALGSAQHVLDEVARGVPFDELAARYNNDTGLRERAGIVHASEPRPGESPEWLHWGDRFLPAEMMEVVLYTGRVGAVHPQALRTGFGVVVVEVLDREP